MGPSWGPWGVGGGWGGFGGVWIGLGGFGVVWGGLGVVWGGLGGFNNTFRRVLLKTSFKRARPRVLDTGAF